MGVFQRIKLILSSNINHAISKAENPEKILEQLIIDMRNQLQEAKKEVAVSVADEKRLERQYRDELAKGAEWERKAMLAVRSSRDDLAREALARKAEHDRIAGEFKTNWEGQRNAAEQLKASLVALADKIEEARRKKNLLIARAKRAEAQKKIHDTMSGLSDTSAFDTFDRMTQKVDQIEAQAAASVELGGLLGDGSGDKLDSEFKALEAGGAGEDANLLALKQKMGLLPAPGGPAKDEDVIDVTSDIDAELQAMKDKAGV